jgi:hypothetical protein
MYCTTERLPNTSRTAHPLTQGPIDTEHEDTNSTKEDMEGVDGDIHDRFEKLEFDDARRKCRLSITNKDKGGSDDQQDEGN